MSRKSATPKLEPASSRPMVHSRPVSRPASAALPGRPQSAVPGRATSSTRGRGAGKEAPPRGSVRGLTKRPSGAGAAAAWALAANGAASPQSRRGSSSEKLAASRPLDDSSNQPQLASKVVVDGMEVCGEHDLREDELAAVVKLREVAGGRRLRLRGVRGSATCSRLVLMFTEGKQRRARLPGVLLVGAQEEVEAERDGMIASRDTFREFAPEVVEALFFGGHGVLQLELLGGRCCLPAFVNSFHGLATFSRLFEECAVATAEAEARRSLALKLVHQLFVAILPRCVLQKRAQLDTVNVFELFTGNLTELLLEGHARFGPGYFNGTGATQFGIEDERGSLVSDGMHPQDLVKLVGEVTGQPQMPAAYLTKFHEAMARSHKLWRLQCLKGMSHGDLHFDTVLHDGEGRAWVAGLRRFRGGQHVFVDPARFLASGLLAHTPVDGPVDARHLRSLVLQIASSTDTMELPVPGAPAEASSHVRFAWAFARQVLRHFAELSLVAPEGRKMDRPSVQMLWAMFNGAVEMVTCPWNQCFPERKRLALHAAVAFASSIWATVDRKAEPKWLSEKRARGQPHAADDLSHSELPLDSASACLYLQQVGAEAAWVPDCITRKKHSALENTVRLELAGSPGHTVRSFPGLQQMLADRRRLLVTGEPGSGRTSAVRGLLAHFAQEEARHGRTGRLPLRVPAAELAALAEDPEVAEPLQEYIHRADDGGKVAAVLSWERLEAPAWAARSGHQAAVLQGRIVVAGGLRKSGGALRDAWVSHDSGQSWEELPPPAWPARCWHQLVAFEDKLYVLGGIGEQERPLRDAWASEDGGRTWRELPCPSWPARYGHQAVVYPLVTPRSGTRVSDHIIVLGGNDVAHAALQDAWASENGGYSWRQLERPPWPPRCSFQALPMRDKLLVVGGQGAEKRQLRDVWVMSGHAWPAHQGTFRGSVSGAPTPAPVTWAEHSELPWQARSHHCAFLLRGQAVICGGLGADDAVLHDAWASRDGQSWKRLPGPIWQPVADRHAHQVVVCNGQHVVLGGADRHGRHLQDVARARALLLVIADADAAAAGSPGAAAYLEALVGTESHHQVLMTAGLNFPGPNPHMEGMLRQCAFAELRLQPLTESDLRALCARRLGDLEPEQLQRVEAQLLQPEYRELVGNPLLATIVLRALCSGTRSMSRCDVYQHVVEHSLQDLEATKRHGAAREKNPCASRARAASALLPPEVLRALCSGTRSMSRCDVYQHVVEHCLQDLEATKRHGTAGCQKLQQLGVALAAEELAFELQGRGLRTLPAPGLAQHQWSSAEAMDSLARLRRTEQLLLDPHASGMRFNHLSMQEFLAAKHVWRRLGGGDHLPNWLLKEVAGNDFAVGCGRFFCALAAGRDRLPQAKVPELWRGLGGLLRNMSRAGDETAVRGLVGIVPNRHALLISADVSGVSHTSLHLAAINGHCDVARALLELAPDREALNAAADDNGLVALHCAAQHGHEATIRAILERSSCRSDLLAMVHSSETRRTALHSAAKGGHHRAVRALLELAPCAGQLISAADASGLTALHVAAQHSHVETARTLLELTPFCDVLLATESFFERRTALHLAAEKGGDDVVRTMLGFCSDMRGLLAKGDAMGQTALHFASDKGHAATISALLKAAPDPQELLFTREQVVGQTALHFAADAGHAAAARALVESAPDRGAILCAIDRCGRQTALHLAAEKGHEAVAVALLKLAPDRGTLLAQAEGFTGQKALHFAAGAGHACVVRALLERAPDCDAALMMLDQPGGFTPLHLAAEKGHGDVAQVLVEFSPHRSSLLQSVVEQWCGFTALHLAAYGGHETVAQVLLDLAADREGMLSCRDYKGRTAVELAMDRNRTNLAAFLTKAL